MHIPDHMMNGTVCPVTAAVSITGLFAAAISAFRTKFKPDTLKFASVTALIFAAQMMNFPVQNGTSGHLIGTTLAIMLLGIPFGIISVSLVITIQCLVFADGGISVLGTNILNMAVIAALPGIIFYLFSRNNLNKKPVVFLTALLSVISAAAACSVELALSGAIEFTKVFPAMISVHFLIGTGEAIITLSAVSILSIEKINSSSRNFSYAVFSVSAVITLILSSFASSYPDGLEWAAEKFNFLHNTAPLFVSPLPDYTLPAISNEFISTSIAGFTGVLIIIFLTFSITVISKKVFHSLEKKS